MPKKRRAVAEINVVPYIDVMLVLLIIFMITAPIVQQGIEIELPKVAANSLPPDKEEPRERLRGHSFAQGVDES